MKLGVITIISLGAYLILIPVFWMLTTSLKSEHYISEFPPQWIPREAGSTVINGKTFFLYYVELENESYLLATERLDPLLTKFINPNDPNDIYYLPTNVATRYMRIKFHWENYFDVWNSTSIPIRRYMLNTLTYAGIATIAEVLSSSFIAFGFARLKAPGKNFLFMIVLGTMMIPPEIMSIPLYLFFTKHIPTLLSSILGFRIALADSWFPLILPKFFGDGFLIFMMHQFYLGIPKDYDDAARIDGCSYFQIWLTVILPMSLPVIIAAAIISFQFHWAQDYFMPLLFINTNNKLPLTVGLANFQASYGGTPWHLMMAASAIAVFPLIMIFFILNRYFIQGIVISGMKE